MLNGPFLKLAHECHTRRLQSDSVIYARSHSLRSALEAAKACNFADPLQPSFHQIPRILRNINVHIVFRPSCSMRKMPRKIDVQIDFCASQDV